MAYSRSSYRSSSRSSSSKSYNGKSYSSARAHQKVGQSFGGYTKVKNSDGSFSMKKSK